jgi:dTDP-4-amino-4,6-dideoxygalactose transaminase
MTSLEAPTRVIPVMRPWLGEEEAAAAAAAVASGWIAQGPRVAEFERAIAERVGAAYGVAVSSCTTALHLALVVLGIGPGDEVVVPSMSFVATANAARYVGATPVFADVEPDTLNCSPATIRPVLSARTRAVILVHQAGIPADVAAVRALASARGIHVIEDAACAMGSTLDGRPIGSHSDLVTFSFHPRKLLTTGEGGMVVTSREDWARRLRRLREHGMDVSAADRHASGRVVLERYVETGFNYRMTDVQAAIGLVQLRKLDAMVARRRQLAARYAGALQGLELARDPADGTTNYQSFWVVLPDGAPDRDAVLRRLLGEGISARRGIMAAHLEPAYDDVVHAPLPVTERLTRRSLILPLFHDLTEGEQDHVIAALHRAMGAP